MFLTRKGERREYWLEVKATPVSLGDADFLQQLAEYIALYLSRSPENRFKLILGCYKLIDWELFNSVFEYQDAEATERLIRSMLLNAKPRDKVIIENARAEDIKTFFEDTTVEEADLKSLDFAEAKVIPKAPAKPSLAEAAYAEAVINNFGDVSPLAELEKLYLNVFSIELPQKLFIADGLYKSSDEMYANPSNIFPPHDFRNSKVVTFSEFKAENPLSYTIVPESIRFLDTAQYCKEEKKPRRT